jgi:uncharacterized protein (DUF362 family)
MPGGWSGGATAGQSAARRLPATPLVAETQMPPLPAVRIAVTSAGNRAEQTFNALKAMEKEIAAAIGDKPIIIKPNLVAPNNPLAVTNVDTLEAILEFLKSIKRTRDIGIAESPAMGGAGRAYQFVRYPALAEKYGVKLLDIDQEDFEYAQVINETDMMPRTIRVSKLLRDGKNFVISAGPLKTHNFVVATMTLKNVIQGAPLKNANGLSDKPVVHGGGYWGTNYNLYTLARILHPHLSVLDAFQGMEGNGPGSGTPVDHRVCVAGLDWLSVDRVGLELMGLELKQVGYLAMAAAAQMGQSDLSKIEVIGEPLAKYRKTYKLAQNANDQLSWVNGPIHG